jgi:hypothetical protein
MVLLDSSSHMLKHLMMVGAWYTRSGLLRRASSCSLERNFSGVSSTQSCTQNRFSHISRIGRCPIPAGTQLGPQRHRITPRSSCGVGGVARVRTCGRSSAHGCSARHACLWITDSRYVSLHVREGIPSAAAPEAHAAWRICGRALDAVPSVLAAEWLRARRPLSRLL